MELFVSLAVFSAALAIRLTRDRRWIAWVVWFWVYLIGYLVLALIEKLPDATSLLIVAGGSITGVIVPEIWQIIRGLGRSSRNTSVFDSKKK